MIDVKELRRGIDRGRVGENRGLPHGLNRLVEYVPGIQQSTYYLVGGESSSGKSAFTNNCFVFNPMEWILDNMENTKNRIKVHYYSFEISKEMMLYKAVCRRLFLKTGILLDVNYILSRGRNRISDEHYNLVTTTLDYLEPLNDMLSIYDVPDNPGNMFMSMIKYAKENGKGGLDDNFNFVGDYKPNNENLYNIIIVDHISLLQKAKGLNTKESIDKLSELLIILRNKFRFTPVVIQQLNRSNSSAARINLDKMEPMLSDLKDSGGTVQDCNVCLALFNPNRYDITKHRGYKINPNEGGLGSRYRSLSILKNRDGESDKTVGLKFIGECGHFEELKKADFMSIQEYEQIIDIRKSI